MSKRFYARKVAVLGAGVMGAQLAAHLVNANAEALLFDLTMEGKDPNALPNQGIKGLRKLTPAPLATQDLASLIVPGNYDADLERLRDCDLIIEVIAERPDWKHDLYRKIAPYLREDAVLVSNTSGLSINGLAEALPEAVRHRFCGMHFFNPPRYMPLVELIPGRDTDPAVLDSLETFLVTTLGKGALRGKDTCNFIANRIGVFNMLVTIHHAQRLGIPFEAVDALTGQPIGRPKSGIFRLMDVVGLDTLDHIVESSAQVLKDDPWQSYYVLPGWYKQLVEKGALGQKTGAGFYRKAGKNILVLDPEKGDYQPTARPKPAPEVQKILGNRDQGKRFAGLRASEHPQAQFLWAIHRDVFHYAAVLLEEIADNARDLDLAIRWGFGWKMGPLETWQAAGWRPIAKAIADDIQAGKSMAAAPLPAWVEEVEGVHTAEGSWAPADKVFRPRSGLPVYRRQHFPEQVFGEAKPDLGKTVYENDGVRLWHLGDDIGILSFKTKMNAIGDEVLNGILQAVDIAEQDFAGLVIWQPKPPFSVGANLAQVMLIMQAGDFNAVLGIVDKFQRATGRLRYASIPVVGAVQGMALGGGCETLMHCDRVVAALESYIGLVEVGVGVVPAGGGLKELARRAAVLAPDGDPWPFVRNYIETVAMATTSKSAKEAQQLGFLSASDVVILNSHELLYVARAEARALAEEGYRAPLRRPIRVAGSTGIANIQSRLVNMRDGGYISEHDYLLGSRVAEIVCGGEVEPGTEVDEAWLLHLEREAFVALARTEKTAARIGHMLQTGKPLRN